MYSIRVRALEIGLMKFAGTFDPQFHSKFWNQAGGLQATQFHCCAAGAIFVQFLCNFCAISVQFQYKTTPRHIDHSCVSVPAEARAVHTDTHSHTSPGMCATQHCMWCAQLQVHSATRARSTFCELGLDYAFSPPHRRGDGAGSVGVAKGGRAVRREGHGRRLVRPGGPTVIPTSLRHRAEISSPSSASACRSISSKSGGGAAHTRWTQPTLSLIHI